MRELLEIEAALWAHDLTVAGLDEVGAGPLAGPVVAACVVLPAARAHELLGVDDSKLLSEDRRVELATQIRDVAIAVGLGQASVAEIDKLNIRRAALVAMKRAFDKVATTVGVDHLLVDARVVPGTDVTQSELVGGDRRSLSIAAASIVAKVHRDGLMVAAASRYPEYGFQRHKGYGTAEHLAAIQSHGVTAIHRRSFAPVRKALGQPELFE